MPVHLEPGWIRRFVSLNLVCGPRWLPWCMLGGDPAGQEIYDGRLIPSTQKAEAATITTMASVTVPAFRCARNPSYEATGR